METFLSDYKNEYKKYLLQVLVELGTVYLKERYLGAAKNLFLVTLAIDPKNVDAKNNIAVYLRKRNMPGDNDKAVRILREEEEKGNRFALINVLKCRIAMIGNIEVGNAKEDEGISKLLEDCRAYEKTYYSEDCLESVLREKIMEQPEDLELKLLLGLYYKKKKQWNKALKVFQEIYEKSPNIRKGTIGLKAYYNIVQEYMRKKQFHKAKVELEHIIADCKRDFADNSEYQTDFLAEMDSGWCLQNLGYYEEAQKCYERLLKFEDERKKQDGRYETKKKNEARVRNNLGACYLYQGKYDEAREQFEKVLMIEKNNSVANKNLGQYYVQLAREWEIKGQRDNMGKELEEAIKYFQKAAYVGEDNIEVNSNLIIAQYMALKSTDKRNQKYSDDIKKKLRFMNNSFSVKACFYFANYIEEVREEERDTLYRAFARIKIGKEEEAYSMFHYFQNESAIRRLSTESRGKMLAKLFQIYEKVLAVKKICRYVPEDKVVPVHYTSLKTLKILLNEEADSRLRLWNTADMNDPVEGEAFLELLKEISKNKQKTERQEKEQVYAENLEETEAILAKYFKHLSNSTSGLVPGNGNVYITSFTKHEDFIPMWNAYAEDAKGCAIKFGEDFFDIKKETDMYTGVSSYSDKSYILYEVMYLNPQNLENSLEEEKKENRDKLEKVKEYLDKVWELLISFERYQHTELAKYGDEISLWEEVRLIKCSYEPKVDRENFDIPRLYIEVDKDINKLKEVCLGKKISQGEINKLVTWFYGREKVEKITLSSRHYQ